MTNKNLPLPSTEKTPLQEYVFETAELDLKNIWDYKQKVGKIIQLLKSKKIFPQDCLFSGKPDDLKSLNLKLKNNGFADNIYAVNYEQFIDAGERFQSPLDFGNTLCIFSDGGFDEDPNNAGLYLLESGELLNHLKLVILLKNNE